MTTVDTRRGMAVLNNAALNKSTAFSVDERERLNLRGLLPAAACSQATQLERVLANLRRKANDIERYIFLCALQARNERLFYCLVLEHIDEIMPLVYTPTVGQACKEFAHIFRQPQGFYLTPADRGEMRHVLDNWPDDDVRVIVVTDGERILGLGDLGANGMGIPIGKLSLYTACAGIPPHQCLPVMLDVGTNNVELREDPLYLGVTADRLRGEEYDAFVAEFVDAVTDRFPNVLIQFEDFVTENAIGLLSRYRQQTLCFNDDIQGTATVVLAGIYNYAKFTDTDLNALRFVFLGAGSANTGIASLLVTALKCAGLSESEALGCIWLVDLDGLVTADRADLPQHLKDFAKDADSMDFVQTLRHAKPQVLIGATGAPGSFTQEAIETMAALNERPAIFALSNPTDSAECTAEQAYHWSEGRAIFASGSPFEPVEVDGQCLTPGQANNVYVFPGIGRGAIAAKARYLPDEVFLAAARALAGCVDADNLTKGNLYPPLTDIRNVSLAVADAVAESVFDSELGSGARPASLAEAVRENVYDPRY